MATDLAIAPATSVSTLIELVLTELAENDFLYWLAERDRAQAARRALSAGATFEQVAETMQLDSADVAALVA